MFFLVRFTYIALLLIFTQLLIPAFQPGGRFLILLIAAPTAILTDFIRRLATKKALKKKALFSGLSIIPLLFASGRLFTGVKLTFLGILVSYLGLVFLELMLPDEWHELIYRKYRE